MIIPNTQSPEKAVKNHDGNMLDFHSMFFTLQGEGPFSGQRSVFVRLAGCNLMCPGCDTEYTAGRHQIPTQFIVERVNAICHEREIESVLVVITGGEPLRQNISKLVFLLLQEGHTVQIETNGVLPASPELEMMIRKNSVHLVVSPKTWKIHPNTAQLATGFKYVIQHTRVDIDDGLPTQALAHTIPAARRGVARPPSGWKGVIYVNPMDEQDTTLNQRNLMECRESALRYGYRMGVQLHKLLNLE